MLQHLQISDARMEEGEMRCDINLSLEHLESGWRGSWVEIKNVQGVKFIEKAIEVEMIWQADMIERGEKFGIETWRYDAGENKTYLMRVKEEDLDYWFMRDMDLNTYVVHDSHEEWVLPIM